jgi:sigma-B regulation protein RsbU (phosphoserine phosphatase)
MPVSYAQLLVISNDKKNLTALGETLRELTHYDVTLTSSLAQGEHLSRAQTFDIILMDICLKAEVFGTRNEELRQFLSRSAAPVPPPVIVAGRIEEIPSLTQCIEDGAADYLLLPTNPTLLEARIRPHLQKKRLQEQALSSLHAFNEVEKLADDLRLVILPLGIALSAEKHWDRLLERFVVTAMDLCNADAGSLFMRTDEDSLRYEIMRVKSLDVVYGGTSGEPVPYDSLPLYNVHGQPDLENVATFATHEGLSINIANIYDKSAFDFSGTHRFDQKNNYRTTSCLTVPLQNNNVIGVLQLRNAIDPETRHVTSFGAYQQLVAESLASQAAVAVHNRRLRRRETSLLRYKRELQIGRGIQASFFPAALPQPPGWELAALFHAAREVAGDFYDAFALPHGKIGLVIADVCDKGVVAALFMALLRSLLRATIQQHYYLTTRYGQPVGGEQSAENLGRSAENLNQEEGGSRPFTPMDSTALLDTVRLINGYIGSNHADTHIFATLFFGILDPSSGKILYANCGHIPPLLRAQDGTETNLMPTGPAVGLLPEARYTVQEVQLQPGDTLLAYTDGVTEARNPKGNLFGEKRLMSLIAERPYDSAAALLDAIEAAVKEHTAGADPSDDITMLALRRSRT